VFVSSVELGAANLGVFVKLNVSTRNCRREGLMARGFVFVVMGAFVTLAALRSDPRQAIELDGALEKIAQQPYGALLLAFVAVGLFMYGAFQFLKARYRRFAV
jgi:hypothetical protein